MTHACDRSPYESAKQTLVFGRLSSLSVQQGSLDEASFLGDWLTWMIFNMEWCCAKGPQPSGNPARNR